MQATVLVIDPQTGVPIAVLEGGALTAMRTAAASGLATDLLADPQAQTAAILGAGVLARTHLEAVCTVRDIQTAWIHSPTPQHVEQLIQQLAGVGPIPRDLRLADNARQAVQHADVICCATSAATLVRALVAPPDTSTIREVPEPIPELKSIKIVKKTIFVNFFIFPNFLKKPDRAGPGQTGPDQAGPDR